MQTFISFFFLFFQNYKNATYALLPLNRLFMKLHQVYLTVVAAVHRSRYLDAVLRRYIAVTTAI